MQGRILIADSVSTHRITLGAALKAARYETFVAASAEEAAAVLAQDAPDLLLADRAIAVDQGLIARLRTMPGLADLPVVMVTDGTEHDRRAAALRAGASDAVDRAGAAATLLARIRSQLRFAGVAQALGQRDATVRDFGFAEPSVQFQGAARLAFIARDTARAERWREGLGASGSHAITATVYSAALDEAERARPADLFVIEAPAAHPGEALSLLADLRARPGTRHAAVLIVYDAHDPQTATMALDLGASDVIEAGFHPDELSLRIDIQMNRKRDGDRLRASVNEGLRLAVTDPLTGLFNRRYALTHARRAAADPGFQGFCVIVADVDRFKSVNDRFGHRAGDAVLVEMAQRLRDNLRAMDIVARLGGEEFLVYLPDPDPQTAHAAALRLCEVIHADTFALPCGGTLSVTASFGVAHGEAGDDIDAVIDRADKALYAAKEAGRDTVAMASAAA